MLKNKLKKIFSRTIDNSTHQIVDIYDSIKNQWDPIENSQPFPENPAENKDIVGKWKCEKGHFWYETIENRAHYQICHMCHSPGRATEVYNLFYLRPDLDKEWHPTKNGRLTSDEVTHGSDKKVWWRCAKGHEWQIQVSVRTRGNGCPECVNRKVGKDNNLAVLRPDLLAEWDQEANGDLSPQDVIPGSSNKVAWKCEKEHQWKEKIFSRVRREYGCPTCFPQTKNTSNVDKLVLKKKGNNLLSHNLYKEWHPIKNGLFNLENVFLNTNKRAWWICENGHEWEALINNRSKGLGCPECANKKVGKDNNLAVMKPELANEWHPTKNGELTSYDVVPGSGKKVWWRCNKGHEWEALISHRTEGRGCSECANQKVGKDNNLAVMRPDLANEWHPTKNGELTPFDVVPGSHKKVWWKCNKSHVWEARISSRFKGRNCPECCNRKVGKDNNLAIIKPELANEWHPTKNGELTPYNVVPGSRKKVWWKCHKDHEWEAFLSNRIKGSGCHECSNRKAGKDNNLAVMKPKLANEWHPTKNGVLTPYDVVFGSHKEVWWRCKRDHEWEAQICARTKGNGCPDCANKRVGRDNNLAVMKPNLVKEWHPTKNGELTPYDVVPGSDKKVWWRCKRDHEWEARISSRALSAVGCLKCYQASTLLKKSGKI